MFEITWDSFIRIVTVGVLAVYRVIDILKNLWQTNLDEA